MIIIQIIKKNIYPMYILLVYERELSKNDYLAKTSTNNNYKKHQKVNKKNKNKSYYLKVTP